MCFRRWNSRLPCDRSKCAQTLQPFDGRNRITETVWKLGVSKEWLIDPEWKFKSSVKRVFLSNVKNCGQVQFARRAWSDSAMVTPTPPRTEPDHMARGGLDTNCGTLHLRFEPCVHFEGRVIRNQDWQGRLVIEESMTLSNKFKDFKNFSFFFFAKKWW